MLTVRFSRDPPEPGLPCLWLMRTAFPAPEPAREAARAAGFSADCGELIDIPGPPRAALLGLGAPKRQLDWEQAGAAAGQHLATVPSLAVDARGITPTETGWLAAGLALGAWRFTAHRTRDIEPGLDQVIMSVDDPVEATASWAHLSAAVRGCLLARDLVSEPANVLTTRDFATRLESLTEFGIQVDVWGRKRLTRAGFGALLAVGQGSASPPRLAVLRWKGSLKRPPVAFVGKGLVFDTGGISIKGATGMEGMRADMAGAAACAGALLTLALRRSPAPAVAVLAIAENATGAASYRPGDVLHTASGRTVEVVDTDAEGRLVLADALHHAITAFRPRVVIDLATLTGAIISALGHHRAGMFGTDSPLQAALAAAGEETGERLWPMPIGAGHREDLHSEIADLRQCVPSSGANVSWASRFNPDASHAAAFLREFVGEARWAHLDIAGVDTQDKSHALGPAGATGFGVRLLDRLIANHYETEP